ncbi:MAG: T9SS type A sorting domain-containing protein [Sphingobacteriaceae bacterium]|nr:MAG: T9SS type A sorting domain-containing protein [Sphingobacteriaceae bacterium]
MTYKITLIGVAFLGCAFTSYAQKMSLNSDVQSAWVTVPPGVKPVNENVLIRAGNTITIDADASCNNLAIEKAAILTSTKADANGATPALQAGVATDSAAISNSGTFGGDADGLTLRIPAKSKYLIIKGTGKNVIGSITPVSNHDALTVDITEDVTLNAKGVALSANGNKGAVINIGKNTTVTLSNTDGVLQTGKGTYNINGTLDMAATASQTINSSPQDNVILNVNGKFKLGKALSIASNTYNKQIQLNIADGGLVDATNTDVLNLGQNFFAIKGNGALLRLVDSRDAVFPVGIAGADAANGVVLKNTGKAGYFKVGIKNKADAPIQREDRILDKQWIITPESGTANFDLRISPSWTTADQKETLDPSTTIAVKQVDGGDHQYSEAGLSGRGQAYAPFTASATGFKTGGSFTVIKHDHVAFTAYPNPAIDQVTITHPKAVEGAYINITTLFGKKVFETIAVAGNKNTLLNINALDNGIYIVKFDNGGKNYAVKIIKSK